MKHKVWIRPRRGAIARVALAVALLVGVPMTAGAADAPARKPLNLSTSPLPINLETKPGGVVTADIKVKQNTGETARLKASLLKFTAYGEEGKPRLLDRQPGDDYFDWVKFDKPEFDAPNDVWQTVRATITVPKQGAAFGYYYAVVFTRVGDDAVPKGNVSAFVGGTATLILLNVDVPGAKRSLSLESFKVENSIMEFLPGRFEVKFKNTGNVHLVPKGNIFISRGGKQVGTISVNEQNGNILPSSNRIYKSEWGDGYPRFKQKLEGGKVKIDKNNNIVYEMDWDTGGKNLLTQIRFGKYTAHLFAVYSVDGRDVPMESEVSFWVIPWRLLAVALVLLILVGFGTWTIGRAVWKLMRKKQRRRY